MRQLLSQHRRSNLCAWRALCAAWLLLPILAGCQSSQWSAKNGKSDAEHQTSANEQASSGAKGKNGDKNAAKNSVSSVADSFKALDDDNWVLAVAMPESSDLLRQSEPIEQAEAPRYRWRHHALEDILQRPREQQPDWLLAIQSDKQIVRVNAAIALARLGEGSPEKTLASGVRAPELKLAVRRAAAESLGDVHSPAGTAVLKDLIDQYSRFTGQARSYYIPEIHAELLNALGHQPGGATDPRVVESLKSPAPVVKREALNALTKAAAATTGKSSTEKNMPAALALAVDMTTDADAQVRIAALKLLVAQKHPQATDKIHRALSDQELSVRMAAIELLGQAGGDDAQARLKRLAADPGELVRVAAIQALAKMNDRDNVESAATDRSSRVRRVVAASLAKHPDRRSVALAQQFLNDASVEVQRETILTTAAWPLETAGPLLLATLGSPNYSPRKDAATLLADRWPPAVGFPIDAPQQRRAELMAKLQQQWTAQFGNIDQQALAIAPQQSAEISAARLQEVTQLIGQLSNRQASEKEQTAAIRSLCAIGVELPAILDTIQADHMQTLPDAIYRDVLPHCGKEFELINQLTNSEPANRRTTLTALLKVSHEKPLSGIALTRVAELLTVESDPIQWISIFKLIEHDPREPAILLATAGMSHPSAEVRRRSCTYFATYPSSQGSELLASALTDDNISVLHAAAQALGEGPPLAEPAPLEGLLTASDHSLRLDAAVSLTRWKLETGREALVRLAADDDPQIRRKTAQAIGKLDNGNLNDNPILPTLITLLDDQQDIRRAALQSLHSLAGSNNPPMDAGVQAAAYEVPAGGDADSSTLAEQAQHWKDWYSRQNLQH